jgi:hypothetical protein
MDKLFRICRDLTTIYLLIIFKRGLFGIISIILANLFMIVINDIVILKILKMFCFTSIFMIFFIDNKGDSFLFKIFHIPTSYPKCIKLSLIFLLEFIQWILISFIENVKCI